MFKIGDFSKLCRLPVSALRYYADIGLLEPNHISDETGYRYYSVDQLPRLNRILALKDLGLSLTQIKDVLQEDLSLSELRGMLKLREREAEQELAEQQARLQRIRTRLQQIENEGKALSSEEVILKDVPAQPVLSIREVIAKPEMVGTLMMACSQVLMREQAKLGGVPLTIFHDEEFKEADLDIEIVFPLQESTGQTLLLPDERKLVQRTLAAVPQIASILHTGSYDTLVQTYETLGTWIEQNQYQIKGQYREIYLRPDDGEQPALTEIQIPIERT